MSNRLSAPLALSRKTENWIAAIMIAGFALLAVGYSLGPLFEGPDELAHYRLARDILRLGPTPDPGPDPETDTYEYYQPPLYYYLQGLLKSLLPDPDFASYEDVSTRFNGGFAGTFVRTSAQVYGYVGSDNVNLWVHSLSESFPYQRSGTALAVHVMRLLSVLLVTCAVVASYGIFRALWPDRPDRRMAALAVVAFWPSLHYDASVIDNDVMIVFMAAVVLWLLLRLMRDGPTWKGAGLLGITLGLALLSKPSGLLLIAPVGLAVVFDWRRWWRYALLIFAIAAAIGGWYYVHQAVVYNDPTGLNTLTPDPITTPVSLVALPTALIPNRVAMIFVRMWARFGPSALIAPGLPIDLAFIVLILAGLSGASLKVTRIIRQRGWQVFRLIGVRQGAVLAVFGMVLLAGVVYRVFTAWYGNQGRYLLPDIAGLAALLVFGLDAWTPPRLRSRFSLSLAAVMACLSMLCLFGFFLPSYRLLPVPDHIQNPLGMRYGAAFELLGSDHQQIAARPNDVVSLMLHWRALDSSPDRVILDLHTSGFTLFAMQAPPARGMMFPGEWIPGQTWSERYRFLIRDSARPGTYQVYVLVYNRVTNDFLPVADSTGAPVTEPVVAEIIVHN